MVVAYEEFNIKDEVVYCGRRMLIVGVRQPSRYETERHYDIARKLGKKRPDLTNVPAKHLSYPTVSINTGMGCQVVEFRK